MKPLQDRRNSKEKLLQTINEQQDRLNKLRRKNLENSQQNLILKDEEKTTYNLLMEQNFKKVKITGGFNYTPYGDLGAGAGQS